MIRLSELLEKCARMLTTVPLLSGLESLNLVVTKVFDTNKSFDAGKSVGSSGSAEAKSQTSSVDAPLLCF